MSFETLKEEELRRVAEMFAVDLDTAVTPGGKVSKKLATAAFAEEGVTWELYQEELTRLQAIRDAQEEEARLEEQRLANTIKSQVDDDDVEPEEDVVLAPKKRKRQVTDEILVKMDRQNGHYEIAGKVFTREHPFVLMSADEAQAIFDLETGFRVATPREAAEYYS